MASDIALVIPYLNVCGHDSILQNFRQCRERLRYRATVVELSLTGRFHAATEPTDIQLLGSPRSIMLQHHRLVNLAIRKLPDNIRKVAWIEPDVLFSDPQWLDKLSEALDEYEVVQPFSLANLMGLRTENLASLASWCSVVSTEQDIWATTRGLAWGANLDALPSLPVEGMYPGLLDRMMVNDETAMATIWAGMGAGGDIRKTGLGLESYCLMWGGTNPQRKLGFLDGTIHRLYRGDVVERTQQDLEYLRSITYDPMNDIVIDAQTGLYQWSQMRERAAMYFLGSLLDRYTDRHLPAVIPRPDEHEPDPIDTQRLIAPAARSKVQYRAGKPTVAIITPSLGLGGAEQWIRCLVTHCHNVNWVVGVLGTGHWHPLVTNAIIENALQVHAPHGIGTGVVTHDTVDAMLRAVTADADAVITWGGGDYWPLPTSAPVVFVGHGTCQWTTEAAQEAKDGGATHFVAVSNKSADVVKQVHSDVRTIWNGVDTTRLIVPEDRFAIRKEWRPRGYDYERFVGYVGRLGNEKNLDSVIHAMASLPYHYQLVLIGCTGWKADRILTLARTVLPERVIEIPATDKLGVQLGGLDCIVQVSPREGHSLVLCEAMLTRTPIISNLTGALPELNLMATDELVEVVPMEPTTVEIADAIRRVCQERPESRLDFAHHFATRYLTEEVMCRDWEAYLSEIIATPKTGRRLQFLD